MKSAPIKDYENIYLNIIEEQEEYENIAKVKCDNQYKELNHVHIFDKPYSLNNVKNEETHGQEENKKE